MLPLLVLGGLFGFGVHLGNTNREPVLRFEREVLRLDVAEPRPSETRPPETRPSETQPSEAQPSETQPAEAQPAETQASDTRPAEPIVARRGTRGVAVSPKPESTPSGAPLVAEDAPTAPRVPDAEARPPVGAPPVGAQPVGLTPRTPSQTVVPSSDLGASTTARAASAVTPPGSLGLPVTVSIKVLVDREIIENEPDWIAYVQRLINMASGVYEAAFGIELSLYGVTTWDVATRGVSTDALLADLRSRPREGAHVLLGLTGRAFDAAVTVRGDQPGPENALNGGYAVICAGKEMKLPHLRALLHELGHLFGAQDVSEAVADAMLQGSWMRTQLGAPHAAPWIDPGNRRRIIARKSLPFAPEPGRRRGK